MLLDSLMIENMQKWKKMQEIKYISVDNKLPTCHMADCSKNFFQTNTAGLQTEFFSFYHIQVHTLIHKRTSASR